MKELMKDVKEILVKMDVAYFNPKINNKKAQLPSTSQTTTRNKMKTASTSVSRFDE